MKHARIQISILLLVLGLGSMGPPVIGALRESVQQEAGLSRADLGMWVFLIGTGGSLVAMAMGVLMRRTIRPTFVRAGMFGMFAGCCLLAWVRPAPGWALAPLAVGWLVMRIAHPLGGASNGVFADLWESSPHTGIIILHALNALGKVLAPLAALLLGTAVRPTALAFAALFGLLALESLFWPRESIRHLKEIEEGRGTGRLRLPRDPFIWACTLQFAFIAGAEGGAVSILGSLVTRLRPVPVEWISPGQWPSVVLIVITSAIFLGRTFFAVFSLRMTERAILRACLTCGLFAVPAAFLRSPALYLPSIFLTGICFSATWPAFFGLAARAYPPERTFLSLGAMFFTAIGLWGTTFVSSAIGNVDRFLPHAFVASTAFMLPFACFLLLPMTGRALRGAGWRRA